MLPDDGGRSTLPLIHDADAYAVLAASLGMEADALERELAERAAFLEDLADGGVCDPPSVAVAVRAYPDRSSLGGEDRASGRSSGP
jgi:hypothetical protein